MLANVQLHHHDSSQKAAESKIHEHRKSYTPLHQRKGEVCRVATKRLYVSSHLRLQIVILWPHVVPDIKTKELRQAQNALSDLLLLHANVSQILQLLLHAIHAIVQDLRMQQTLPTQMCLEAPFHLKLLCDYNIASHLPACL